MADENKKFLDKIGVQYLWDKINEYFSQIGHRHETSDVNGLDEYMEENARAIKDTKKVVEELPELPLYPTEEQLGNIYECDGVLYRGKRVQDSLIWEEVSEDELRVEDTTPATEDTKKRFYREIDNNNVYVTDAEYNPGEGGFIIDIVHPRTGQQIDSTELRDYIDPNNVWLNSVDNSELIYADNRYWNNELGERVTITPIRIGTNRSAGSIQLSTKVDVDLYFSPYISFNSTTQQAVVEQTDTTVTIYDANAGETIEYKIEVYDNINLLEDKWTIVHVPASSEVYVNTSRRCYLHKIIRKGEGEGDRYYWSQIAKIQDIEDRINALPEVARTGNYSDLFNKPCIGDVQVYDWPSDEELPIIDEGAGNCDNRLKQLMRWNYSLYTAVFNDSGLSIDMRDYSNSYNTQGYCGNTLRTYIFENRIEAVSGAYKDYFLTGNTILIQNTKGIGVQFGSSNSYGDMLLSMRSKSDNQRYLFNSVEVGLQSWSSDGETTTDNGNVYVEVGTTLYREKDFESELMLIVDSEWNEEWSICKKNLDNLTSDDLQAILNTSGNTIVINGNTYQINDYWTTYNKKRDLYYCGVSLDTTDNLDYDWAYKEWEGNNGGYDVSFRVIEQVLTPQQTKNAWFKRYSGEYVDEWVETVFTADCYVGDPYIEAKIGGPSDEEVSNFVNSLNQGDKLKINGIILTVNGTKSNVIVFDYADNFQEGGYTIYKLERTLINNPLLRETVSLQGTNCDYIRIWTQYDENPEQYGRRCVLRSITFNNLKYEYDPRPEYNRIITRRDYWKQISGNGSIKVIDLT